MYNVMEMKGVFLTFSLHMVFMKLTLLLRNIYTYVDLKIHTNLGHVGSISNEYCGIVF
jgi:hypothetical protein